MKFRKLIVFSIILILALNLFCFLHFVPLVHTSFETGWVDRYSFTKDNGDGTYTWIGSIGPQTFWDDKTNAWQELEFVVNPTFATVQDCHYFVRNSHVALEICDTYVKLFDPDYTHVSVYSEQWSVEYYHANSWKDRGVGFQIPTWKVTQSDNCVNITRVHTLVGVGQLNVTYIFREGAYLKHEVVYQSWDFTAYNYRVVMSLAGITNNHVKTDNAEFHVTGKRHEYSSRFLVGQNDTSMVYQEYLQSVFNQTVGNLTDIVFNTHAQGIKADIIIGNWNLAQNQALTIDPDTSTFVIATYNDRVQGTGSSYVSIQGLATGNYSYTNDITIGQFFSASTYWVERSFFRFATSTLNGLNMISAQLSLGMAVDASVTDFVIRLQKWTEASDGLSTADYNGFDGVNYDDGLYNTVAYVDEAYANITISNLDLINKTGYTDIAVRSAEDIAVSAPTTGEEVTCHPSSEPLYPLLRVEYIPAEYDYVDSNTSNVDSSASIGTQSNFTTEKYTDNINDTLTEASYGGANTTSSVLFDGFEAGNFNNWDGNGATTWTNDGGICINGTNLEGWASYSHSGTYYAGTGATGDGQLWSDDLTLSGVTNIGIRFWYAVDDTDGAGELTFGYGNSVINSTAVDISGGIEDTWTYYSVIVTTSSYFTNDFFLQFIAACGANEAVYVDDVLINKTVQTTLMRLDLEEQFTNANFSRTSVELCVKMRAQNNSEGLQLDYWNATSSAWVVAFATLTMNQWNNVSVKVYTSNPSVTFTIRFVDNTQTVDTACDTWDKDACLLHTWDVAGGNLAPTISDMRLSAISDTNNISQIDVNTWYDWEANVSDSGTLLDIVNVTIRIKDNPTDSIITDTATYNRTGEYWFNYANASNVWQWYSGSTWTVTSDWLDNANCVTPTKTESSGYYLFRTKLAKSAVKSTSWGFSALAYDSGNNVTSKNFTGITVNAYSSLLVMSGNSTHTWINATSGVNDILIDQGAIYFNITTNFLFKIQAKGDGNLIKGSDYIGLGNVTIHKDTLGSSVSLTTIYADVGGLTSQALGEDIQLSLKLWLDSPTDQPLGNYVYTLSIQVTAQ